jgi:hypothetical protein
VRLSVVNGWMCGSAQWRRAERRARRASTPHDLGSARRLPPRVVGIAFAMVSPDVTSAPGPHLDPHPVAIDRQDSATGAVGQLQCVLERDRSTAGAERVNTQIRLIRASARDEPDVKVRRMVSNQNVALGSVVRLSRPVNQRCDMRQSRRCPRVDQRWVMARAAVEQLYRDALAGSIKGPRVGFTACRAPGNVAPRRRPYVGITAAACAGPSWVS